MRRLALDVVLWYYLPVVFLSAYVGSFAQPASAVLPHLRPWSWPPCVGFT